MVGLGSKTPGPPLLAGCLMMGWGALAGAALL
jgi:hypothetical protein